MKESRLSRLLALPAYAATLGIGYWWNVSRDLVEAYGATLAQRTAARDVAFSEGGLLLGLISFGHVLVFVAVLPHMPPQPLARLCVLEGLIALGVLALLQHASPLVGMAAPTVLSLLVYGTLLLADRHTPLSFPL